MIESRATFEDGAWRAGGGHPFAFGAGSLCPSETPVAVAVAGASVKKVVTSIRHDSDPPTI